MARKDTCSEWCTLLHSRNDALTMEWQLLHAALDFHQQGKQTVCVIAVLRAAGQCCAVGPQHCRAGVAGSATAAAALAHIAYAGALRCSSLTLVRSGTSSSSFTHLPACSGLLLHAVYHCWLKRISVQCRSHAYRHWCTLVKLRVVPCLRHVSLPADPRLLLADSWPQALALLADPRAAPTALALLNDVVDTAWHAAGDRSSDFSW